MQPFSNQMLMKKLLFFAIALIVFAACTNNPSNEQPEEVTVSFAPARASQETSNAVTLADYCTQLDVWFVCGNETIEVHSTKTDDTFGAINATLSTAKTYVMYAVAHKCASAATLSGNIISFPDEKVTHAFYCSQSISPATATSFTPTMSRIVGQFRLETTDPIPNEVTKFRFTVYQTGTRWNISTNTPSNVIDRVSVVNLTSRNSDGSATLILYIMAESLTAESEFDILVEALNASDEVLTSHTFDDVPIKDGYKTIYQGAFMNSQVGFTFVVSDWETLDTILF